MRTSARPRPAKHFRYSPLIAAFACAFGTQASLGATFPVTSASDSGTGTLREAIGLANANCTAAPHTITFSGPFVIALSNDLPPITCANVAINGGGNAVAIQPNSSGFYGGSCPVTANSVLTRITGLEIRNFTYGAGICGTVEAVGNNLHGNLKGLYLTGPSIVTNNQVNNNGYGVYQSGGGSTISANTISGNDYYGLYGDDDVVIVGNTISGNGWDGIRVFESATITGNTIFNNSEGIIAGAGAIIKGNTIHGHLLEGTGIYLYNGGVIGGPGADRNILYDNDNNIYASADTYGGALTIENNLIGTPDGVTTGSSYDGLVVFYQGQPYTVANNVIVGNSGTGLSLYGNSGTGTISGNHIGVNAAGTAALGNNYGISVYDSSSGPLTITGNVISGNSTGVNLDFSENVILSANKIGTNSSGTAGIANSSKGISAYCSSGLSITGNVISSNGSYGGLLLAGLSGSTISGNLIGTAADGVSALSNNGNGISVGSLNAFCTASLRDIDLEPKLAKALANNLFDGNVIAHNNGDGILVSNGNGNVIRGGSIHSNIGKNISLNYFGAPLPQSPDNPAGTDNPNNLQNHPDITSAVQDSGNTVVGFSLGSIASTSFDVDIYANTGPTTPAGRTFLGRVTVATVAGGTATGTATFPGSHTHITATATGPYGTSEFSGTLASLVPAADILPLAVNFGNVVVPGSGSLPDVVFTSTGSGPYIIDSIVQAASPPSCPGSGVSICSTGAFACSTTCVPGTPYAKTDPATAACKITGITFNPMTVGAQNTNIYICDNTSATARAITLSGNGIPMTLSVNPTSYNFGNIPFGTTALSTAIVISNPTSVEAALGTPTGSGPFSVSSSGCSATLAPAASCNVIMAYTPTSTSQQTGTLTVPVGNSGNPVVVSLQGAAMVPYAIAPASFNFGTQALNVSSAPHSFTLSNASSNDIPLGTATTSTGFSVVSTTCAGKIPSAGSCAVSAAFTPTANGPASGQLTVPVTLTGAPAIVAALNGTGGQPSVTLPASVDLGTALVGAPDMTAALALQNTSTVALAISSFAASSPFQVSHACPASLAPGASCSAVVSLTPSAAGNFTGTLTVITDAPSSPHAVALTAAVQSQQGQLSLPTGIDLGTARLASSPLQQALQIKNTGNGNVDFTSIAVTAPFQLSHNCPASLAPGAACVANLSFAPLIYGNSVGQLTVASNAAGGDRVITLLASVNSVTYGVSPAEASFGSVPVGSSSTTPRSFIISNNGDSSIPLSGVSVTGPFSLLSSTCGTSLGPRSSCTAEVAFAPVQSGGATGKLSAQVGLPGAPPATSALSGTGTQQSALALPESIDFGSITLGSTSTLTRTLELRNTGNAVLTFSIGVTGPFVLSGDCGLNLAPSAACNVVLTFTPTTVGEFPGSLSVVSNAPGGSRAIALIARVQAAPRPDVRVSAASVGFADQFVGSTSATQRLTLTNAGGVAATLSPMPVHPEFPISSQCGPTLAPQASCTADIAFRPLGAGPRVFNLNLVSDSANSPRTVELRGRGCSHPRPRQAPNCGS